MHTIGRFAFHIVWFVALLAGCGIEHSGSLASPPSLPPATSRPSREAATTTPVATSTIAAVPMITAIPTTQVVEATAPSPTPRSRLRLAVTPVMFDAVSAAVATAAQGSFTVDWTIVPAEDPSSLLSGEGADAALVRGAEGTVVTERKLVLTVPFTTDWENVSESEARGIVSDGHPLVSVMYWAEMGATSRPLRVDGYRAHEQEYPLVETWSILSTPQQQAVAAELGEVLWSAMGSDGVVHLAAVGDIMLARTLGNALSQDDVTYPFKRVEDVLKAADLTIGNLESALGNIGEPAAKHYTFRAPALAALALNQAGFDIITLANNHALDYGPDALLQGISLLQEQDMAVVGAGANAEQAHLAHVQKIDGVSLAFLGYVNVPVEVGGFDTASWAATADAPGLAWGDAAAIGEDVAAASARSDVVVVLLHSGYEYVEAPSEAQAEAAHAAIDSGAKLVIGHHAHILQGIEFYKDGVIVYGLGNFAFDITGPQESAILNVWLDKRGVRQLEIVPVLIQTGGQPRLAEPWEAAPIRRQVYHLTNLLSAP